jgi:hypothetical protein
MPELTVAEILRESHLCDLRGAAKMIAARMHSPARRHRFLREIAIARRRGLDLDLSGDPPSASVAVEPVR